MVFKFLAARVAAIGEPWKTFFRPEALMQILREAGFTNAENLGAAELNARYFEGRTDGLRIGEMMNIAIATN